MITTSRRRFLHSSGLGALALGGAGFFFDAEAAAAEAAGGQGSALVVVFLRGALDGLSAIVPHAEDAYYDARPRIAIAPPGEKNGCIDLDGRFGLHPALASWKPLYDKKQFAPIVALGSPDRTRSHFAAQDRMETGVAGRASARDGWLNRSSRGVGAGSASVFRAVAAGSTLPLSLRGRSPALAIPSLAGFGLIGPERVRSRLERGLAKLYPSGSRDPVLRSGAQALAAVQKVRELKLADIGPQNGAKYPRGRVARRLKDVARLLQAPLGVRVACVDWGGWDTHAGQGAAEGQLARKLRALGQGLAAFRQDLGKRFDDVTVLAVTEFGRTVAENGTGGTDHGHGSAGFVFGGRLSGGKVYGRWPGLGETELHQGRDLAVTTDYRDVFAEVVSGSIGGKVQVFPGYKIQKSRRLGLV